jgi:hypothetical protein
MEQEGDASTKGKRKKASDSSTSLKKSEGNQH